ncbi:MAG: hypothetical protein U0T80_03860 [Flavobacteriaceae bacterium]
MYQQQFKRCRVAIISAEGCKSYTTLNIQVLPVPTPNTAPSTLPALCRRGPQEVAKCM